ncbi:hypothetical protein V6N12_009726 [Hibiscus sabdariffa]|uniref:Uncharacterized protein n=1 Tax=Hibiscus sabdariffa TaxID=183260 RepID=A0ABR2ALC4_9ROSI
MNGEVLWDKTTGLECEYDVRGEIIILVQKLQEDHIKAKLAGHLFEEISETRGLCTTNSIQRAWKILGQILGRATSAYNCNGVKGLRDTIVVGIEARDYIFADPNDIFLTDGVSPAVHMMM